MDNPRTIAAMSFVVEKFLDSYFLFALVLTLLLIFYFLSNRFESNKTLITVPWNLPLVGNFPWICLSLYRSRVPLYEFMRQLKYKYGDIYSFNICGHIIMVVNDFQAIKEMFDSPHVSARQELCKSITSVPGHEAHHGKICKFPFQ